MNLRKDHCRTSERPANTLQLTEGAERGREPVASVAPPPFGRPREPLPPSCPAHGRGRPAAALSSEQRTPARNAPRNLTTKQRAPVAPVPIGRVGGSSSFHQTQTTLGNGYLGSRIDEERSKMRYLV